MDMNRANRWLMLGANVGVIAGILFLAVEIQQANRIAIASTEIDVRNSLAGINESIYSNPEIAELIVRSANSDAEVTAVEDFRLYVLILRLLNTWLAVETAYENGMVPPETYAGVENDIFVFIDADPRTSLSFRRAIEKYQELSNTGIFQTVKRLLEEQER